MNESMEIVNRYIDKDKEIREILESSSKKSNFQITISEIRNILRKRIGCDINPDMLLATVEANYRNGCIRLNAEYDRQPLDDSVFVSLFTSETYDENIVQASLDNIGDRTDNIRSTIEKLDLNEKNNKYGCWSDFVDRSYRTLKEETMKKYGNGIERQIDFYSDEIKDELALGLKRNTNFMYEQTFSHVVSLNGIKDEFGECLYSQKPQLYSNMAQFK